jgi:hypothetical protein
MSAPDPRSTGEHRRPRSEPVEMSAAEKLACEREARHDVVGRGRISDIAPVQHYLSHARTEGGGHRSTEERRARPHASPQSGARPADAASALRSWVRWGEDGGPATPVIPRCCAGRPVPMSA